MKTTEKPIDRLKKEIDHILMNDIKNWNIHLESLANWQIGEGKLSVQDVNLTDGRFRAIIEIEYEVASNLRQMRISYTS